MAQPTQSDVHVNAPLTNVSIAFIQKQDRFIADKVFPNVPVMKQGDVYYSFPKSNWFRTEAQKRAPATESAGSGYTLTTGSYFAQVTAIHKDVDDQMRANADSMLNPDRAAAEFLTQQCLLRRDLDWKASFFTTSLWTGSSTGTDITPSTLWSAPLSTPIADITAEISAMEKKTGFKPNKLVLGAPVWYVLKNHPDFLDRIKYTQTGIVSLDLLAAVLELDEVLVASAVQNTANEGATDSMDYIFGKAALLCYAAPTPALEMPSAGYVFSWTGYLGAGAQGNRMKRFRMEELSADRLECEMAYDMKQIAADLGVFFSAPIA